jgi:predicted unusual protein kinase regulating ubiquinone biosynthesis (AarF/ABC1/UbiB family)
MVSAVKEMQIAVPKEFDFQREARLMGALRQRMTSVAPDLVIPEPVLPLCGPGIIVMQRMQGEY